MIKYAAPNIDEDDIKAVSDVMHSGTLTQGRKVREFEDAICEYIGCKEAIAFNSATTALNIAAAIEGIENIKVTPNTFIATVMQILHHAEGNDITFIDIAENGNTNGNKTNINMSFAGIPNPSTGRIHDACHALGSSIFGKKIGRDDAWNMTIFSTHAIKNITTGEGGLICTNDYANLAARYFRDHGKRDGEHWYYGGNYRMTDMQAALGISQLKKIDLFKERKKEIANAYWESLKGYPIKLPEEPEGCDVHWHLFPCILNDNNTRDKLKDYLLVKRIETQIHYKPVYLHPYFIAKGYKKGLCPNAEKWYETELSIPMHSGLTGEEQSRVIQGIQEFFELEGIL